MNCHICLQPAIGQCQRCWKFYCADHGDRLCTMCTREAAVTGSILPGFRRPSPFGIKDVEELRDRIARGPIARHEQLVRVIAVGQTQMSNGSEVSVLSLDLYDDGVRMNYRIRDTIEQTERLALGFLQFDWKAVDDVGTNYISRPLDGGGSDKELRGAHSFSPALPQAATRLELSLAAIPRRDPTGARADPILQPGPWRFEIPLT